MTRFGKDTPGAGHLVTFRRLAFLGLLAGSVLGVAAPARAASLQSQISDKIKSTVQHLTSSAGSSSNDSSKLNQFLKAGPAYWSVTAPYDLPPGLKVATNTDGTLKDTPLARYLVWKRDQAPDFFDKRHPKLAPAMQLNDQLRTQAQVQAITRLLTQQAQQLAPKTAAMQVITPPSSTHPAAQTLDPGGTASTTSCTCAACSHGTSPTSTTPDPQAQVGAAPVPEPASIASTFAIFAAAGLWVKRRRVTA